MSEPFQGFPQETIDFLVNLEANNNREWFEEHKSEYKAFFDEPAKQFLNTLLRKVRSLPHGGDDTSGKVFRIYRDVRFSQDKSPYRTDIKIGFSRSGKSCNAPMLGVGIDTSDLQFIGGLGGRRTVAPEQLKKMRLAIADDRSGKQLQRIVLVLQKKGFSLPEPQYKRVPRGFDTDHPREALLRQGGLFFSLQEPLSGIIHTPKLVAHTVKHFRSFHPLHEWIDQHMA